MAIDAANLSGTSVHCALDQRLQLSESRTPRHVLPDVVGGMRVAVGFNVGTCSCAVVTAVAAAEAVVMVVVCVAVVVVVVVVMVVFVLLVDVIVVVVAVVVGHELHRTGQFLRR